MHDPKAMADTETTTRELTVFYIPGMCGCMPVDRRFLRTLMDCGRCDVRSFDWPCYLLPLINLRSRRQHRDAAARLARELRQAHREQPERRIAIVSHSTGAIVTLEALAQLDGMRVAQAWLLAAAVSRGYDLRPALPSVGRLVNLHSRGDVQLIWGTRLFGSADGRYTVCAGHSGFNGPGSDDPRIEQWTYRRAWRSFSHRGRHLHPLRPDFVRGVMLPAMLDGKSPGEVEADEA